MLRKLCRFIEQQIINMPILFDYYKILFSELWAIGRKRAFYKKVTWSSQQKNEFDEYWVAHYGKKISSKWHKLYESMNGFYSKEYFPEILYTTKLEPMINHGNNYLFFNDKTLIELLYASNGNNDWRLPKTYMTNCEGCLRNRDRKLVSMEDCISQIYNLGACVIKPTLETGSGHGVEVLDIRNGIDIKTGRSIKKILETRKKNYIIQEKLNNSNEFKKLFGNSINTIRLITYIVNDEIHYAAPVMRIGVGRAEVDNIHNGGLCVGVNENGTLKRTAYQLGYGDSAIKYEKHPDSNIIFADYYIGDIQKIINVGKQLHQITPHIGIFSWDFTIDENNTVVLIEANSVTAVFPVGKNLIVA